MASVSTPNISTLGRLDGTGLLEKGREILRKTLEQKPQDANLWMRLAELERSAGDLELSAKYYQHAANAEGFVPEQKAEMLAVSAMLKGDPKQLTGLEPRRVVPFLVRSLPLSTIELHALMDALSLADGARKQGRIVDETGLAHNPSIRAALDRQLPTELKASTMKALEPMKAQALETLFVAPPEVERNTHSVIDYVVGGGYAPHPDRGVSGSSFGARILTIIAYLDVDEGNLSGGDLLIHDASGNGLTRLRPKTGMMVAFPSEAIHEVTVLSGPEPGALCRRTTLSVWYEEAAE